MPTNQNSKTIAPISAEASMAGILALLIDEREDRVREDKDAQKTEVLLSKAGVQVDAISHLLNKKPDAVRKTIQRAKAS